MIYYNVTVKVSHAIAGEWLGWLKQEHIPEILNTGCFITAVILHLLENDDPDGVTYAVQYHAKNIADYNRYIEEYSGTLRKKAGDKWGDQFIAFRTVMEVVH